MRIVSLTALVLMAGCSEAQQPPAPEHGALWPHRERIAAAFQLRTGALAGSMRKPVRACHRYWETGDPAGAARPLASCDEAADRLATRLSAYLGIEVSPDDVGDPALWRYVAARARL